MASSSDLCAVPERRIVPASDIGALPLDSLCEILLRLQAKELCRLRLVCRLWRSLLSDPLFATAHASRHPMPLIIAGYTQEAGRDVLVDIMDLSGQIVKQVRGMDGDRVLSLPLDRVCVNNIDSTSSSYRVFNPIREELYHLPDKLLDPATGAVYHIPGNFAEEHLELASSLITNPKYLFGQIAGTGEYKVFRMLFHFSIGIGGRQMLEVCSLNGSSSSSGWRAITSPEDGIQISRFTSVVINGIVYSTRYDPHHSITFDNQVTEKDLIFTFDLETETWGPCIRGPPITFPDDADLMFYYLGLPNVKQLALANLRRSLVVVHGPAPYIDLWFLMDSGKNLWVKQGQGDGVVVQAVRRAQQRRRSSPGCLVRDLVRLPAKLLCRLRTVCRLWRSLLSDPGFAAIHAARHPGPLIIASYDDTGRDVLVDIMDLSGQIVKQVRGVQGDRVVSKPLDLVCVKRIDSSNGYRVLNTVFRDVYHLPDQMLNPATGAVYQIPDGFAKEHVALPVSLINVPSPGKRQQLLFEVCTLNSTSSSNAGWRATPPLEERIQYSHLSTVVINGLVYSLCGDPHHSITFNDQVTDKDLIITFDLDTEKWGPYIRGPPISLPDAAAQMFHDLGLPNIKQLSLAKLNGSLAAVHGPAPNIDIWILTDLGKDLWVKQYSIHFEQYEKLKCSVLSFVGSDVSLFRHVASSVSVPF
ncbi:hypothetical protein EJB05_14858, partial [Eragrostis curvula]